MDSSSGLREVASSFGVDSQYLDHLINERDDITEFWPPQVEALERGVLDDNNFLLVSPPGTGKTFVGELVMVHKWLNDFKNSVYLVPYRALAEEKYRDFTSTLGREGFGLEVTLASGSTEPEVDVLMDSQIIVMTYEKFSYYLRNHSGFVEEVGSVVVDEFHKLADPHRGPNLEVLLTKLLQRFEDTKITGLSATVPNIADIAAWFDAEYADRRDWRHNKLHEGLHICEHDTIRFYENGVEVKTEPINRRKSRLSYKQNAIIDFVESSADSDGEANQALIFAPKRSTAEKTARALANYISSNKRSLGVQTNSGSQSELSDRLADLPGSEYNKLSKWVKRGVAYHHAGITNRERDLIEEGFRDGDIHALVATSTLAAGINLPIKRVFILQPRFGGRQGRDMETFEYKNLAGRAGRPGHTDEAGEAVLFGPTRQVARPMKSKYIVGDIAPLESTLRITQEYGILLNLISEYRTVPDILDFLNHTLRGHNEAFSAAKMGDELGASIMDLHDLNMVEFSGDEPKLTPIGEATAKQLVTPKSIHLVHEYLNRVNEIDIEDLLTVTVAGPEFDDGARLWLSGKTGYTSRNDVRDALNLTHLRNQEMDNSMATAKAICRWMDGTELSEIYDTVQIDGSYWGPADLAERVVPEAARILESTVEVLREAEPQMAEQFGDELEQIAARVRYGAPESRLELLEKRIVRHRSKAKDLEQRLGIRSAADIVDSGYDELRKEMTKSQLDRLYEPAIRVQYSGEKLQRELLKSEYRDLGLDVGRLELLFESNHTDFEKPCFDLLDSIDLLHVRNIDDTSGHSSEPEFYAHILKKGGSRLEKSNGEVLTIGFECKASDDLDKHIRTSDAKKILEKAPNADIQITIGNPSFDDDAIDTAREKDFLLLTASALGTLVQRLETEEYDAEMLRGILSSTGCLTREDIIEEFRISVR